MGQQKKKPASVGPPPGGYEMFAARLGRPRYSHRIGGPAYPGAPLCPVCDAPFKAYLLLDPADPRLGIRTKLAVLPILYCHDCETPADVFSYAVSPTGRIRILQQYRGERFEGWPRPRGEYAVRLKRIPKRLYDILQRAPDGWYYWVGRYGTTAPPPPADVDFVEEYALGLGGKKSFHHFGSPTLWIQHPARVDCPKCSRDMPLLLSLGSDHRLGWLFGDVGRPYVFFCRRCRVVSCLLQCT